MSDEAPKNRPLWKLWIILAWMAATTISVAGLVWLYREVRPILARSSYQPYSLEDDSAARERLERITEELALGDVPEWAGTFAFGSGDASRIDLAPKHGVVIRTGRDSSEHTSYMHGDVVEVVDNQLKIAFGPSNDPPRSYEIEGGAECWSLLTLVRWRDRDYLVPTLRMQSFCNAVNGGWEWRHRGDGADYPSRLSSGGTARDSRSLPLPTVPTEFRAFLLDRPVTAHVLEAEREPLPEGVFDVGQSGRTFAWLDAGSKQGLKIGMVFYWTVPHGCSPGTIVELEPERVRAVFVHGPLSPSLSKPLARGELVSTTRPD